MGGKLAMALAAGLFIIPILPLASVSFDLYGDAAKGWGFTSGGETKPGPKMTVDEGDSVTMNLYSDDSLPHQWHLDYDGDGSVDAGEPLSSVFFDSTTYGPFTADKAGTFTYYCTIHAATMYGPWETVAAPPPDVHDVAVTSVTTDKSTAEQGEPVTATVVVENQGTVDETVTVKAMAGSLTIGSNVVAIAAGSTEAVALTWDTTGVPVGDYLIKGIAEQVPEETETADNELTDGTVSITEPPPPPGGDLKAALQGRRAWPDHHHFVISRHGSVQEFSAKVGNVGPGPVLAKVVFTVYDESGALVGSVETFATTITVGGVVVVSAAWTVATGRYTVVAQCWFDTNGDATLDGSDPNTKTFSFAVVP